jgi:lipid A 3-O-deacylase
MTPLDARLRHPATRSVGAVLLTALVLAGGRASAAAPPTDVWQRVGALEVRGPGADYLTVGGGVFDAVGESQERGVRNRSAAARVEYRRGREKLYCIGPMLGLMANTDGGVYGYGGIHAEAAWGRFVLTPFGAAGGYRRGGGKDMGGVFLFRAGVGFNYELGDGTLIGVEFVHMSNAYTQDINPGEEELLVTLALPF